MRKLATLLAVAAVAAGPALGATIRDNCGCGLGTMALGDQEPTIISQLAATFLNGICGNQTFGISSGTLDCEPHAGIASNTRIQQFVADNMDRLVIDMATGGGDTLDALADLMDVPQAARPEMYANLQVRFAEIFASSAITSTEVVENLEKVIKG